MIRVRLGFGLELGLLLDYGLTVKVKAGRSVMVTVGFIHCRLGLRVKLELRLWLG